MFATRSLLLIGIFCISSVISERVICDFEDSDCLTKSTSLGFKEFILGVPGAKSSEPLYVKSIEVNRPELSYKYTDVTLSGMKNCKVGLVKISKQDLKYDYHVRCPLLILEIKKYEINGEVETIHIEGKGDAKVDYYDILFAFHGDYARKAGADGNNYINLKTYELELQVKGKVHHNFTNLYDGDKEKSDIAHKVVNANWESIVKTYTKATLQPLMDKYMSNINAYLDVVKVQDLFSYEK